MENAKKLMEKLQSGAYDELLLDLYVDPDRLAYQRDRYAKAVERYLTYWEEGDVEIYSSPGRSEVGGNHTDHQHGEILAASINLDGIAVVSPVKEPRVEVISDGFDRIVISLDDLALREEEKESTIALIKGVLAGMRRRHYQIGGFRAYITSDVLVGAGLSSSASFETLIGVILSGLYNDLQISAVEIARIGQYAENVYFGKPSGLMDQMACSVGSLVHVDFADAENPKVERVECDMNRYGYSLCITDTGGSHANLTADYAAIPEEMRKVAHFFGKEVLGEVEEEKFLERITQIRQQAGDRGVLRALHFFGENRRVRLEVKALQEERFANFLQLVKASGDSSFKYLQNIYSGSDAQHQNISLALALSDRFLGENGVSRVHGGGFAGTIQAFVKNCAVMEYQSRMDAVFGAGACSVLKIRKYGGKKVL